MLDRTTETTQVLANPDGTFTVKSNRRAVRVKQGGVWRPIDTSLRPNADGSLSPTATDQDVTFSGGGTTPLVQVRTAGKSLAFTWPTPLPTPTVDGDTATYPGVLPGVDLRVIAHADSYSQVLVVHDAAAATNPALASIRMTTTGTGLTLHVDDDGSLSATDPDGAEVLRGAAPIMWDSRIADHVGPPPTDTDPGSGRITPLTVDSSVHTAAQSTTTTSTTTLTLTPQPAALAGPDVVYPLYIDPAMGVHKQHWAIVTSNGWDRYDSSTEPVAPVGYCNWAECNGAWVARSYFEFSTAALQYRNGTSAAIYRAKLYAHQVYSAQRGCTNPQPTTVYESGPFNAGTNYPGPASQPLDTKWSSAGGDVNCQPATLEFDVYSTAATAARNSLPIVAFGLVAPNEGDRLQWKKFDNNPLLEVDFSFPPGQAVNRGVSNGINCTGTVITPDAQPIIYSTATDNNAFPLNIRLGHEVWDSTIMRANTPPPSPDVIGPGGTGQWQMPALGDGSYKVRTAAQNIDPNNIPSRDLWGPWSDWYPFTIDTTPPATPTIGANGDYPRDYWGAPTGAPGMIPVSATDTDAVGYAYTFSGSGTETVPSNVDCDYYRTFGTNAGWLPNTNAATDWIPVPANLTAGYHTLHVKTFDGAHNMSAESTAYTFYIAPNTGRSTQRLEAETLSWSQPAGQGVTIETQPDCCGAFWSGGAQKSFYANAVGQSATVSFTATTESDYQLGIALTNAANYGIATYRLDGQLIGESTVDGYYPRVTQSHLVLGGRHLSAGTHALTITITGTNPNSVGPNYTVGVDYLSLTQTTRLQAEFDNQLQITQPDGQNVPVTTQIYDPREPGPGPFSENAQRLLEANAMGQSFNLHFQTSVEADYALGAALSKWWNYGRISIKVDDIPLLRADETPWDAFSRNGETVYQPFGGAHLTAGTHTLTLTVVDKNPQSSGYHIGIDYVTVVALRNVTTTNFAAAMNNDGATSDGTVGNLDLNGASLSNQTLAAAGYAPGRSATIGGATFTMPTARADGTDNVIAIGQTIPLPDNQKMKATGVGLLVASTCGNAPVTTGTLTFNDNTTKDVRFPAVPDWIAGTTGTRVVTLPYRNEGTTPVPTRKPTIYAIFVPSDPTKTLKSITLPNYGSSLLPGTCATPTLHVLAIAPRPVATGWLGSWTNTTHTAITPPGGTGFANQTLRTVIRPSTTGTTTRIRLTNLGAPTPVTIAAATIAAQSGTHAATTTTPVTLTFNGSPTVTIPAGADTYSDPIPTPTGGSGQLAISLHLPNAVTASPGTDSYSTPTYIATGNKTTDTTGTPFTTSINGYRFVAGVESSTTDTTQGTVAVLGDDLTLRQTTSTGQTWVEALPARLTAGGQPLPGSLVNTSSIIVDRANDINDALNRCVLNQPNLRTAIIALGRGDLLHGNDTATIKRALTALIHDTSATGIRNYRRTDGTRVHTILMTIPPLDLDPNNPIEQTRRALNTDIRTNYADYGADEVIDIATALQDPTNPNKTNPTYYDEANSAPNNAYYDTIAQTIADQATQFPPTAHL